MKTPDESKCGMECIRTNVERICVKPEKGQCPRCEQLVSESLARIRQLESRLAQVERERDAAIVDIIRTKHCPVCVHYIKRETEEPCKHCINNTSKLDWRGVCAENTEEEN